jgi:endonuclease IV
MAILYFTLDANFESCTSIKAKINKLNVLIDAMFNTATKAISTGNHASYKIDDGQSVQEVVYTSMISVQKAIQAYENLKQMYINKLTGNEFRQVSEQNLTRYRGFFGRGW